MNDVGFCIRDIFPLVTQTNKGHPVKVATQGEETKLIGYQQALR